MQTTRAFAAGETVMIGYLVGPLAGNYAMRNFSVEHFPAVCLCGTAACRGSVTGWKDLPAARKAEYGELTAPYLREMDRAGPAPYRSATS